MLSIQGLKSSNQAASYYQQADYYAKDDEGTLKSEWRGKGAVDLGLQGPVDLKQFKELLDGQVNGEQVGRAGANGKEHRPGWDLTLSAPKSVSIVALAGGDKRLIDAHHEAVKEAMAMVEEEYSATRNYTGGNARIEKTANLTVASFTHTTSRALDPQLHTHNVVMNLTKREDGKWRSLESKPIYEHKMEIGQYYRSALAEKVSSLGYQVEVDHGKGTFEIAGVPKEVMEAFSQRRASIVTAAGDQGVTDAKSMEKVAVSTRDAKRSGNEKDIVRSWEQKIEEAGYDINKVIDDAKSNQETQQLGPGKAPAPEPAPKPIPEAPQQQNDNPKVSPAKPREAVDTSTREAAIGDVRLAYKILSDREAVFKESDVSRKVMQLGLGKYSPKEIKPAIQELLKEGEIAESRHKSKFDRLLTTPEAQRKETYILRLEEQGRGEMRRMAGMKLVSEVVADKGLNRGQAEAVMLMSRTENQVVGVQGAAGTGKTYMLKAQKEIADKKGITIRGLSPTGAAAEVLQKETNIKSQTLASFLYQAEEKNRKGELDRADKEMWVVDEASLMNASDAADLLTAARRTGARVVMLGDTQQLGSVEWGKPFGLLQDNDMKTATMSEIQRQKNADLKQAVEAAIGMKPAEAVEKLGQNVIEERSNDKRTDQMKADYMALDKESRENTLVVIPDVAGKSAFNKAVREALQKEGELGEDQATAKVLLPAGETRTEKADARTYTAGTIVAFARNYKSLSVSNGDKYRVVGVDKETGKLSLKAMEGETAKESPDNVLWDPSKVAGKSKHGVALFKEHEIKVAKGDKLVWRQTNKELDLKNGDRGTVKEIKGSLITMKMEDGREKQFDASKERTFDHNYASTMFAAQGQTHDRVMVMAESWRRNLINQKSFYVGISRARHEAKVYTDSKKDLVKGIKERTGNKTSSVEHLGKSKHYDDLDKEGAIKPSAVAIAAQKAGKAAGKAISEAKHQISKHLEIDL